MSRPEKDSYGVSLLILGDPRADRLCSHQSLNVIRGARTVKMMRDLTERKLSAWRAGAPARHADAPLRLLRGCHERLLDRLADDSRNTVA